MIQHKFVPVGKDIHDNTEPTIWRCVGCSLRTDDPVYDAGECSAVAFDGLADK